MNTGEIRRLRARRAACVKPLCAAIAAACMMLAPASSIALAPTALGVVVDNCNDNGTGSLRQAIADAPDGGTVDASALACSVITLSSHLQVNQDDLDIIGPGSDALKIDAGGVDRVFVHSGLGLLTIDDVTIADGAYHGGIYYGAKGGCLYSSGSFSLHDVTISGCTLTSEFDPPVNFIRSGGCVSAWGDVSLTDTRVENCVAHLRDEDSLDGGGVFAADALVMLRSSITGVRTTSSFTIGVGASSLGSFTMKYSAIENNIDLALQSQAGGIQANAPIYMLGSVIAHNRAQIGGGAIFSGSPIDIRNSTIAENTAVERAGVTISTSPSATIVNTTIAFNHGEGSTAGGLSLYDSAVLLSSTIIANNTAGAAARDVGASGVSSLSGSHNLIRVSTIATPPDTISDDPLLRSLHANGGHTKTLALSPESAAIDGGENPLDLDNDQRGSGFPRVTGGAADIGAFEYVADFESIFWDGFDA